MAEPRTRADVARELAAADAIRYGLQLPGAPDTASAPDAPPVEPEAYKEALTAIPSQHVTGLHGTHPEDVQKTRRDIAAKALKHEQTYSVGNEPTADIAARADALTAGILDEQAPPSPNTGVYDATARAFWGNEYPVLDKLPASERALLSAELLSPLPTRGLEAIRTGDVTGSAKRAVGDVIEDAQILGTAPLKFVDFVAGAAGYDTGLGPTMETLATNDIRIGDDIVAVESPAMRLLRVVGTPLQALVTYPVHQGLTHLTPRNAVNVLTLGGGPLALATSLKSPAEMLVEDPALAHTLGDAATLWGGPGALLGVPGYTRSTKSEFGLEFDQGIGGNIAEAWAKNPDQPFISKEAERLERGEETWNASAGWLPRVVADPIVGYLQDISRGRGTTPLFTEVARTAGFEPGTPEYAAMGTAGLVTEFIGLEEVPASAMSKAWRVTKAGQAANTLSKAAEVGDWTMVFEAMMRESFAKGGSVDAVRPALDAMRLKIARGEGEAAWTVYKSQAPDAAMIAQRVFKSKNGHTIDEFFERARAAENPAPPAGSPAPAAPPPSGRPPQSKGEVAGGGFADVDQEAPTVAYNHPERGPGGGPPEPPAPAPVKPPPAAPDATPHFATPRGFGETPDPLGSTPADPTYWFDSLADHDGDTVPGDMRDITVVSGHEPPPGHRATRADFPLAPTTDHPIDGATWRASSEGRKAQAVEVQWDDTKPGQPVAVEWEDTNPGDIATELKVAGVPDEPVLTPSKQDLLDKAYEAAPTQFIYPLQGRMAEEEFARRQAKEGHDIVEARDAIMRARMGSQYPTDPDFGPSAEDIQRPFNQRELDEYQAEHGVTKPGAPRRPEQLPPPKAGSPQALNPSVGESFVRMVNAGYDEGHAEDVQDALMHDELTRELDGDVTQPGDPVFEWAARREQSPEFGDVPAANRITDDEVTQAKAPDTEDTARIPLFAPGGRPRADGTPTNRTMKQGARLPWGWIAREKAQAAFSADPVVHAKVAEELKQAAAALADARAKVDSQASYIDRLAGRNDDLWLEKEELKGKAAGAAEAKAGVEAITKDLYDEMEKVRALEEKVAELEAKRLPAPAPHWTQERLAKQEARLNSPGLHQELTDLATNPERYDEAIAWTDQERDVAGSIPNPDLKRATMAAINLATPLGLQPDLGARHRDLLTLLQYQGAPAPALPMKDIFAALRAGLISDDDAARAVMLSTTQMGRTMLDATPEMKAAEDAWYAAVTDGDRELATKEWSRVRDEVYQRTPPSPEDILAIVEKSKQGFLTASKSEAQAFVADRLMGALDEPQVQAAKAFLAPYQIVLAATIRQNWQAAGGPPVLAIAKGKLEANGGMASLKFLAATGRVSQADVVALAIDAARQYQKARSQKVSNALKKARTLISEGKELPPLEARAWDWHQQEGYDLDQKMGVKANKARYARGKEGLQGLAEAWLLKELSPEPEVMAAAEFAMAKVAAKNVVQAPYPESVHRALGYRSSPVDDSRLPRNPREEVLRVLGKDYAKHATTWDEARARADVAHGGESGAYDARSMLLEVKPHMDGKKYRLVKDGAMSPQSYQLTAEFDPKLPNAKFDNDSLWHATSRKGQYAQEGVQIVVEGSRRPVAEWKRMPNGDVALVPHYGASPEEAATVMAAAMRKVDEEVVRVEYRRDPKTKQEIQVKTVEKTGRKLLAGVIPGSPVELGMYLGPDLRAPMADAARAAGNVLTGGGPKVAVPAHMEDIAYSIEEGMRSHMRSRLGGTSLVPIVGNVMVTPMERDRIMGRMAKELRPLYDIDGYYVKGGLELDEMGNLPLNEAQRNTFWLLNERYGGVPPEAYGTKTAVSPAMTRALHHNMAREMAGRGAWMELAMRDMSPFSRTAQEALTRGNKGYDAAMLKAGGKASKSGLALVFDTVMPQLRVRAPLTAAKVDEWVHALSMVSTEVAHDWDEARRTGLDHHDAIRKVMSDNFTPITAQANEFIDQALAPGASPQALGEIGIWAIDNEYDILPPDLAEMRLKAVLTKDGPVEFAHKWAKRRQDDRRHYADLWLKAVFPGGNEVQRKMVLETLGGGDVHRGLDKLYYDAFISTDKSAWGRDQMRAGLDAAVPQGAAEWYRGGYGSARYLQADKGLGAALVKVYGKMTMVPEDEVVFNFATHVRSEAVTREAIRDLAYEGVGVQAGRFSGLIDKMLAHPDALHPNWAIERGYAPSDVIEAHRTIEKLGLSVGDKMTLVPLADELVSTAYIKAQLETAGAYGLSDTAKITGFKPFDMVMRYYKTNALGLLGLMSSPSFWIANSMSGVLQAYLVRGGTAVGDLFGTVADPAAWALSAEMAEMRSRKWSLGSRTLVNWNKKNVYVFPTGVWSHDDLIGAMRKRGVDAQAARAENAAALIDDVRRHNYADGPDRGLVRKLVAVDDHIQYANEVQNMLDMQFRVRIALGEMKRGATIDEACLAAREALYDYSGLQPFERTWLRAAFPWYTFTKRNSEALLTAMFNNPERVSHLARIADKQPELWGYTDEQKEQIRDNQWGQVIIGQEEGRSMDFDARFKTSGSVNPVADGLIYLQTHFLNIPSDPGGVAQAWLGDLFPFYQQAIGLAVDVAPRSMMPLDAERANEVPAYWMYDPHMAMYMKATFGVGPSGLGQKENPERATTKDESGRGQRWVVGKQSELDGHPELAEGQRIAFRAAMAYLGKNPERFREYAALLAPELRPPGQSTLGAAYEAATGAGSMDRMTPEAGAEVRRDRENRRRKDEATRIFGPSTPQGPGVGIYNESGNE